MASTPVDYKEEKKPTIVLSAVLDIEIEERPWWEAPYRFISEDTKTRIYFYEHKQAFRSLIASGGMELVYEEEEPFQAGDNIHQQLIRLAEPPKTIQDFLDDWNSWLLDRAEAVAQHGG